MPQNVRGNLFYNQRDFPDGIREDSEKPIEGLRCPDCGAQGFETNKAGFAVCGDYPGWYFLYEQEMEGDEPKLKIKIVNGQQQLVPIFKTETIKKHP